MLQLAIFTGKPYLPKINPSTTLNGEPCSTLKDVKIENYVKRY